MLTNIEHSLDRSQCILCPACRTATVFDTVPRICCPTDDGRVLDASGQLRSSRSSRPSKAAIAAIETEEYFTKMTRKPKPSSRSATPSALSDTGSTSRDGSGRKSTDLSLTSQDDRARKSLDKSFEASKAVECTDDHTDEPENDVSGVHDDDYVPECARDAIVVEQKDSRPRRSTAGKARWFDGTVVFSRGTAAEAAAANKEPVGAACGRIFVFLLSRAVRMHTSTRIIKVVQFVSQRSTAAPAPAPTPQTSDNLDLKTRLAMIKSFRKAKPLKTVDKSGQVVTVS